LNDFLLKFPIAATTKRYRRHKWDVQALKNPGYFYLAFDKQNYLHTYVNLQDPKTHRAYNINISRYSLMQALLHSLMIRPARKSNDYKMYVNHKIFDTIEVMPENLNFKAAVSYNQEALHRLELWLQLDLSTRERENAEIQFNGIQDRLKAIDFIDHSTTANAMTRLGDLL